MLDEFLFSDYGTFVKITLDRVGHVISVTVLFFFELSLAVSGYMSFSSFQELGALMIVWCGVVPLLAVIALAK